MLVHRFNGILHLLAIVLITFFAAYQQLSFWWILIPVFSFLTIAAYGSSNIQANYHLHSVCHGKEKGISLTFDDGPTTFTPAVLDILQKYQVKATFFCIGKHVQRFPEILQRIISEGHAVGNHTFHHSNQSGFKNTAYVAEEIITTQQLIEQLTGRKTHWYRPPFGVTNPSIAKAIKQTGHLSIGWNIRSLDTAIRNEEKLYQRILSRLKPGGILLMHDTNANSVAVLERLLLYLREHQIPVLSLEEMIKEKPYEV
ncbi:MAG: polysaccharide deacetylase family protein [Flavobacteriia bacterium]|nr:polysaccharide deacetylase family protein [Flavobacteriia bacterium]OJX35213.1 MAG: hypothetical protein BGO87_09995 [Flavobacteriia bacterium 40-80]